MLNLIELIIKAWSQLFLPDDVTWLDQDSRHRKTICTLKLLTALFFVIKKKLECTCDKNKLKNYPRGMAASKNNTLG